MRIKKSQMLNFQAQLEHLGKRLETFSRINFSATQIEELGTEYQNFMRDLDIQQVCNRYTWKGLPDYLNGHLIELMLYHRASLAGFFNGGILYVLPYAQTQGINVYGMPNAIQPVSYNGEITATTFTKFGAPLTVNNLGALNRNAKAALLFDKIPSWNAGAIPVSRAVLNTEILKYQCDLLARIKNNLRNCDKKVVFWVDSESQKNQMTNDLREAYGSGDPFIVAVRGTKLKEGNDSDTLQGDIANQTQSLFEAWQSLNSIRCMGAGIINGGAFEKKERKITGELQGDQTQNELVLDAGLQMRRLWLSQMKLIYPEYSNILDPITVEINEKSISYEIEDTDTSTSYTSGEGGDNE